MSDSRPVVVSILTINQARLLEDCLASLFAHPPRAPFRVHVFDQASTDRTPEVLAEYRRRYPGLLDVHHHPENVGFVRANNIVFEKYPDHDVVVLNDDTVLTPGWLDALRDRACSDPRIGIVGARLVYPNGVLQEAGAEVFRDATGQNIGKWDDPARPVYLRAMDVDYCSGACLYIRREVLDATGGFDERFAPAYYEDTDLCFQARKLGWRVVYEPASVIIHREGATNGVDLRQGVKRWQAVNRERFLEKWGEVLSHHRRGAWHNPVAAGKRSILFIHEMPPLIDQAAGDVRMHDLMRGLVQRGHAVTLLAVEGRGLKERYADILREEGILVAANDWPRWPLFGLGGDPPPHSCTLEELLAQNDFDLVVIEFHHVARVYLPLLRKLAPGTPVVIDSQDVHFVRERREARVLGEPWADLRAERTRDLELAVYGLADGVITVTEDDTRALQEEGLDVPITTVSYAVEIPDHVPPREERDGLLFVGNFRHRPNPDGLRWFLDEAWPRIRARHPELVLRVAGSGMTPDIRALGGDGVEILGFVQDLDAVRDRSLLSVAPLRFGAGIKGKNLEAMARGLPTVTTTIGAEGMDAVSWEHLVVADDPEEIADAVCRLVEDPEAWERVSRGGREFVSSRWGFEAYVDRAEQLALTPPERRPFPARTFLEVEPGSPDRHVPVVPGVLGLVLAATDPRQAAMVVDHVREVHGGEVDAIVLYDGLRREEWHEHALLAGYRLAVPRETDLARVLQSVAPHLSGEEVLYLDARFALFRDTLQRLREVLPHADEGAVHGMALPAAPTSGNEEPWELAAARARDESGEDPGEILLCRRDALIAGVQAAQQVPGAAVVDPTRTPELRITVPRDPEALHVVVLGDTPAARTNWEPVRAEGTDLTFAGDDGTPLGRLLERIAAETRAGNLLVVDETLRPVHPLWSRLRGLLEEAPTDGAIFHAAPAMGAIPWPGEYHLSQRLVTDVDGLPGVLYMTMPALLFRNPNPWVFEAGADGSVALWRAWQRAGIREPPSVLHDGRRPFFERADWPTSCELDALVERVGREFAEVLRRTDSLPTLNLLERIAPWAAAPERVRELVEEAWEVVMALGSSAPSVTWNGASLPGLLFRARLQLHLAPTCSEVLEARREPGHLERWRKRQRVYGEAWPAAAIAETLALVAHLLASAGRREEARERLAEALGLAPSNPMVLAVAGETALAAGRAEEALDHVRAMRPALLQQTDTAFWPRDMVVTRGLLLETVLLARACRDEELVETCRFLEEWRMRPGGMFGRRLLELLAGALERLGRSEEARMARLSALAVAPGVPDRPPAGSAPLTTGPSPVARSSATAP